jgi:hypothetical protein
VAAVLAAPVVVVTASGPRSLLLLMLRVLVLVLVLAGAKWWAAAASAAADAEGVGAAGGGWAAERSTRWRLCGMCSAERGVPGGAACGGVGVVVDEGGFRGGEAKGWRAGVSARARRGDGDGVGVNSRVLATSPAAARRGRWPRGP